MSEYAGPKGCLCDWLVWQVAGRPNAEAIANAYSQGGADALLFDNAFVAGEFLIAATAPEAVHLHIQRTVKVDVVDLYAGIERLIESVRLHRLLDIRKRISASAE